MSTEILEINIFGGLELKYKDNVIGANILVGRSKKMWTVLEYIVINHDRKVSQEELIEALWPDMSVADPVNSLKVLVFKLREKIDSLGFLPGKTVILSINGCYCWNTDIPYTLDIYEFEKYKKQAETSKAATGEILNLFLKALDCYKGNVLNNTRREPWAATVQTHYIDLYRQVVNQAQKLLESRGEYSKIIEICWKALLIQPYVEEYYYHMIKAYAAMENYSAASDMYEKVKNVMQKEYGATPDHKFEEAYKEILKERPKKNLTVEQLTEEFEECNNYLATFFVEYGEFRQIYRLIARRMGRFSYRAYMCVYTLGIQRGMEVSQEETNQHLRILGEALAFALRQGDVFTRATPNQFAVILDGATVENAETIATRIKMHFDRHKKGTTFGVIHTYAEIVSSNFESKMEKRQQESKIT